MQSKSLSSNQVINDLKQIGSSKKAQSNEWFFKTGKGQYGYGDKFIGVSVPDQRKIAKKYYGLSLVEVKKLLDSKYHECRLTALMILVDQYKNGDDTTKTKIYNFYMKNISRVNNWDLVDSSADKIVGSRLKNKDRSILYELSSSESIWKRRIAIISTFAFIKDKDFKDSLNLCEKYLHDEEDLIHKATGWVLREIGKISEPTLLKFLNKHSKHMPRTALRYSIERLSPEQRQKYMKK